MARGPHLTGALATAVLAGEGALALLRPRDGIVRPRSVDVTGYFSAAEIGRARRFRRPQLAIGLAAGVVQLAVVEAARRRVSDRSHASRRGRHDLRRTAQGAAVAGTGLALATNVTTLPLRVLARRRALDVGLATDSWSSWGGDVAKASAIGAGLSGAGAAAAVAVLRAAPRRWWAPVSAGVVVTSTAGAVLAPVLLDPIFNRFTDLDGEPRDAVLALAADAGVDVGRVLSVDASRRTSAANAYVTGLGHTKRVVLFDTLLDRYPPAERDLVIAHELAHVRHRDVWRQVAFLAITAPAGARAAQAIAARLDADGIGAGRADARSVPALALAFGVSSAMTLHASLRLSRRVENRADTFALTLRPSYDAFVGFEQRIAVQNLADPDPPRVLQLALGTHPTTVERIGIAEALRAGDQPSSSS